ncbi:MAG: trypsin-like peptidase domain-containing protein [Chloroflexota bacterium]|nr:trypsin-like peptidase domain-containing protein [Chloroflexota bacterium]
MSVKSRKLWDLIIVCLLLFVGIGCSLAGVSAFDPTPAPTILPPTATTARPMVTPIAGEASSEVEAITALQSQITAIYGAVSPAVVNITNRSYAYDIFMRAVPQEGSGSGFVYDAEGHIVTNYHVVENAEQVLVTLASGQVYEAEIVGADPANDLAVIRIDAGEDLPELMVLADSDNLQVGQFVLAIGNPFGLEQTLTTGVVSALGRVIESSDSSFIGEAIQTDAAINPGNSGGPLLDLEGRVVGVNSQIISPSGASAGIGFAISSNTVKRVVPELIARGYYPHPWLGAQMLALTPSTAEVLREAEMNVPVDAGLLVIEAVEGAPADKAGIRGGSRVVRIGRYQIPLDGDIIVAVNGEPINNSQELTVYLESQTTVGDTVEMTIIRDGEERVVQVTLEERP